jgi:NAD(P)-dependent dehydrogenase (short-subunit alcohol dehydrogenase family)
VSHKKVWLITGASRGMGVDFAKAALAPSAAVRGRLATALIEV